MDSHWGHTSTKTPGERKATPASPERTATEAVNKYTQRTASINLPFHSKARHAEENSLSKELIPLALAHYNMNDGRMEDKSKCRMKSPPNDPVKVGRACSWNMRSCEDQSKCKLKNRRILLISSKQPETRNTMVYRASPYSVEFLKLLNLQPKVKWKHLEHVYI